MSPPRPPKDPHPDAPLLNELSTDPKDDTAPGARSTLPNPSDEETPCALDTDSSAPEPDEERFLQERPLDTDSSASDPDEERFLQERPLDTDSSAPEPDEERFLQELALDTDSSASDPDEERFLQELLSRRVAGRYTGLASIGTGGQGRVFRCQDTVLGREVAIKLPKAPRARGVSMDDRFFTEARLQARLLHPNILPIIDSGAITFKRPAPEGLLEDTPLPFFTMPFIGTGELLDTRIKAVHHVSRLKGLWAATMGWSLERLIQALVQVGQAVAFAHKQGVFHRDIKPKNILLGHFGELLLIDWGIAKTLYPHSSTTPWRLPTWTARWRAEGTPGFMAPEQAFGRVDDQDERVDVYALGAVLYTILAGERPYADIDTDTNSHLRALYDGPPSPISSHTQLPIPVGLLKIVEGAMQRDRAKRIPSASVLVTKLQRWLDNEGERRLADDLLSRAMDGLPHITRRREAMLKYTRDLKALRYARAAPEVPAAIKRAKQGLEAALNEVKMAELAWLAPMISLLQLEPGHAEGKRALAAAFESWIAEAVREDDGVERERLERLRDAVLATTSIRRQPGL